MLGRTHSCAHCDYSCISSRGTTPDNSSQASDAGYMETEGQVRDGGTGKREALPSIPFPQINIQFPQGILF